MASIRPKTPAEIRSSSSTPSGSRDQIRSALYFTSGRYSSTSRLRMSWFVGSALNFCQICATSSGANVVIAMHILRVLIAVGPIARIEILLAAASAGDVVP